MTLRRDLLLCAGLCFLVLFCHEYRDAFRERADLIKGIDTELRWHHCLSVPFDQLQAKELRDLWNYPHKDKQCNDLIRARFQYRLPNPFWVLAQMIYPFAEAVSQTMYTFGICHEYQCVLVLFIVGVVTSIFVSMIPTEVQKNE